VLLRLSARHDRAKQIDPADMKNAPPSFKPIKSTTKNDKELQYKIQVYVEDCVGCGSCVETCPAKTKALEMRPLVEERKAGEVENVTFFDALPVNTEGIDAKTLKGSQFLQPLFEFSGACAGCGETPYVRLVSQLFGDRMIVANATGCSSIYGGTFPTVPYCVNSRGEGPAWGNSLFEDNAEYGFGMRLAVDANRSQLKELIEALIAKGTDLGGAFKKSLELWDRTDAEAKAAADAVKAALPAAVKGASGEVKALLERVEALSHFILDKSVWIFGGDGWAYDIGYGGLDHVLASGRNVNVLVLDTEVYSNTGGQASKSTPIGAIAQFAASGKKIGKKDLGLISMTYGIHLRCFRQHGCGQEPAAQGNAGGRGLQRAVAHHRLRPLYQPRHQHALQPGRHEEGRGRRHWPLYRYNPQTRPRASRPHLGVQGAFHPLQGLHPCRAGATPCIGCQPRACGRAV
jgi:pyruvate-ferredoxin/flavodoxin oxidoreductase